MTRILGALLAAILVASCATTQPSAPGKPRLVVLLVIDGFPQRQVIDYRDQFAPDGFRRFLDRGAWFRDAHYAHAFTNTCAGHATMLTGAYPHRTGIVHNDWRVPATGELTYCAADEAATYLGHSTRKLDGTSPKNLRAETVGDVLRRADPRSKVVAISVKDRGAIMPAGKTGTAYMYMPQTGQMASSTYYMKEHPAWVTAFNAAKPADAFFHREWKPLLADDAYARSLPDNQAWYAKGGSLPKKMGEGADKPGPLYYGQIIGSPYSDELMLDFARAAIAGEGLGQDEATDILSVSLSGHDYVNHAYGAESRISHDHVLQVDRLLQAFFRDLDAKVGKDNYVIVFTADHGFMPAPEHSLQLGRDAGRTSSTQMAARLNKALAGKYGPGDWLRFNAARGFLVDRKLVAEKGVSLDAVAEDARKLLLAEPGILEAYTRAELQSRSLAGRAHFDAVERSWHPDNGGDVEFALKPYWMLSSSSNMTTHGSPHAYDTNVPILFYGPKWIAPGPRDGRVEVADIASTLAGMLGIAPPPFNEGKPLPVTAR